MSARLQRVNEAFEDSAPLHNVLLAVCREFGLTHAVHCLEPAASAADVDMADATGSGEEDGDEDGDASDGDEDATWSAAERDDKETIVSDLISLLPHPDRPEMQPITATCTGSASLHHGTCAGDLLAF